METTTNKNTATLLQLSAYSQYFFPFGNFIFPIIIWSLKKKESEFVDYNGKQVINFQLSIFLYTLITAMVFIPIFTYSIIDNIEFSFRNDNSWSVEQIYTGNISSIIIIGLVALLLFVSLKTVEFFLILYAAIKNSNGENFNYPLNIKFIK